MKTQKINIREPNTNFIENNELTNLLNEFIDYKNIFKKYHDNIVHQNKIIRTIEYNNIVNTMMFKKRININEKNSTFPTTNSIMYDIYDKTDNRSYNTYSIKLLSALIPSSGGNTPSVTIINSNSDFRRFTENDNIFKIIYLDHINGTNVNASYTKYYLNDHDAGFLHEPDQPLKQFNFEFFKGHNISSSPHTIDDKVFNLEIEITYMDSPELLDYIRKSELYNNTNIYPTITIENNDIDNLL